MDKSAATPTGKLIAEFGDFRAGIFTTLGYTFGALGTVLLTGGILSLPPKVLFGDDTELAFFLLVAGTVFFAIGKFFQKKRLVIYQDGIVQIKWGRVDAFLWRDLRQMYLQRVTRYGSGLAYNVRYHCSLQRGDGTWLALNAIPITSQVVTALRQISMLGNSEDKRNIQGA